MHLLRRYPLSGPAFLLSIVGLVACATGGDAIPDAPIGGLAEGGAAGTGGISSEGGAAGKGNAGQGAGKGGGSGAGAAGQSGGGAAGSQGGAAGDAGQGGSAGTGGTAAGAGGTQAGSAGVSGMGGSGGDSGQGGAGAGGDGGQGGAGMAGEGGAGASAGQGGAGAGGAGAGGAGMGGAGEGGAGAGGAGAGGAGAGGAGAGGDSGMGGAGGQGGAASPTLVAVASSSSGSAFAASYTPDGGWVSQPFPLVISGRASLSGTGAAVRILMRRFDSVKNKDFLWTSSWVGGQFSAPAALPGDVEATDGPTLSFSGTTGWATFLQVGKHRAIHFTGGTALPDEVLGSDPTPAFGATAASVVTIGNEAWAVYSGADEGVYAVHHNGTSWSTSAGIQGAGALKTIAPLIVLDDQQQPTVLFVRNDGKGTICSTTHTGAGWTAPVALGDTVTTLLPLTATHSTTGALVVAWHGHDNQGIYVSQRPAGGSWSAPLVVEVDAATATAPALAPGVMGAEAELLYGRGGTLRHARLSGGAATLPTVVPGSGGISDVAASTSAP